MLVTLSQLGFYGDGYDFSEDARRIAKKYLNRKGVSNIALLSKLDEKQSYDYIFAFEVIGYLQDLNKELGFLRNLLKQNGKLIISFVKKGATYSSNALGKQTFFYCTEVEEMLSNTGYRTTKIWNYGYPLANMLSPFLSIFLLLKLHRQKASREDTTLSVQQSGLFHENVLMAILGVLINRITIYPLAKIQLLFKNTNLGNGYIVLAERI